MFRAHLVVLLVACGLALEASSDWDNVVSLKPGSTIEVTRNTDPARLRGKLVSVSGSEINIIVNGQGIAVARGDTARVRVRAGRARGGNMLIGAAIVGGVFLGTGLLVANDLGGEQAAPLVALSGIAGALIGSGGAAFWRVSWRPVYAPAAATGSKK